MGGCCSKSDPEERARNMTERNPRNIAETNPSSVVVGTNKPLLEFITYQYQDEVSRRDLLKKRSTFWETEPAYSVSS